MGGPPARLAAAKLLAGVLKSRRTLDDALATEPDFNALSGRDRAFARAMVSAALRHLGRLDRTLVPLIERPIARVRPEVMAILRIGAAQLWLLDTPEHAAVGETVAATKRWPETARATGLVNAVLRKAVGQAEGFAALPASATWPDWLLADFKRSLGPQAAERLAEQQLATPDLHLTAKTDVGAVAEQVGGTVIGRASVALPTGGVEHLAGYGDGDWWVQDVAAALAVQLLAPRPGDRVFDLCAAPGGKTLQLAAAGAAVVAVDRSKPRLKRLRANLERTGLSERVDVIAANIESWTPGEPADAILLDAPCSALGTLRRHPEGAWIKSEGDVDRFPEIQARMLAAATRWLKPGGRLVYCVCTPRAEEGRDTVDRAVASGAWRRDPIPDAASLGFGDALTAAGDLLTIPGGACDAVAHDAFFISRLKPA